MSENTSSKIKIQIQYENNRIAYAILQAITPDNLEAPENINIITKTENNILIIKISCNKSIASFVATLDDLLQCLQAAESALQGSLETKFNFTRTE